MQTLRSWLFHYLTCLQTVRMPQDSGKSPCRNEKASHNKKAVLSQRWPCNAPHIWVAGALKIFRTPWLRPQLLFPTFLGVLFWFTLWMCVQNLKSVALPVLGIIGVPKKNWAVPRYAHAPSSPKVLWASVRMHPVNVPDKFQVRSFTCYWVNRG